MATSATDLQTATCPRCLGRVENRPTEHVCADCGLVVEDAPVTRHRPRIHDGRRENRRRYSIVDPNLPGKGLGTGFGGADTLAERRQARLDTHAREDKADYRRRYGTSEIRRIGVGVGLPQSLIERGQFLFRQLHDAASLAGRDLDVLAPACLYAACREQQAGRTPGDLEPCARCAERPIARQVWWVAQESGLELPPPSVPQRVRVVAARLGLPERERQAALAWAADAPHDGTSPSATAAAACYAASGRTQADCAEAAGVTPVTLRSAWQDGEG